MMAQTGKRARLNTLASENKEMRSIIEQLTTENRHLRQLEIRQTKALQKYERSEYSLPGILHHHQKQTEGFKEQIKKHQATAERHERRSRHLEDELAKTNADNETLKKMAARGGGGDKESEGTKRRHEELKQKAETAEKEIATLKKHIDNLNRNHRREVASLQKREKESMSTMLSLQEKCKDSTRLLMIREKEANVNNIYSSRGRGRDEKPPRSKSLDHERKASISSHSESRKVSAQQRSVVPEKTIDQDEIQEHDDDDDDDDNNINDNDVDDYLNHNEDDNDICDNDNNDIGMDAESQISGVKSKIQQAEMRLGGGGNKGGDVGGGRLGRRRDSGGDGNPRRKDWNHNSSHENKSSDSAEEHGDGESLDVISVADEMNNDGDDDNNNNNNDYNHHNSNKNHTHDSVSEGAMQSRKPTITAGRKNIVTPTRAITKGVDEPLLMPRPPSKPKETPGIVRKEKKELGTYPAKPLSPAGLRLVDYESRMAKIRQKNQEKLVELRKKLDEKIGVGGRGNGNKVMEIKNDYDFKFPYDTLRRRRKGAESGSPRHVTGEEADEERRAEAEADTEVAEILDEGEEKGPEDHASKSPSKQVVDMVMSWNSENKQRGMPDRPIETIDIGNIDYEEENAEDRQGKVVHNSAILVGSDNSAGKEEVGVSGKEEDVKTEEQNEGKRLSTEIRKEQPEKAELRSEFGRKPEVHTDSTPEVLPHSAPTEAASMSKTSPDGVIAQFPQVQAHKSFPDGKTPPNQNGTGEAEDSFFEEAALSDSYRQKSTSILKASTTELRERNRERRRVNFFQSQWIIEEEEEDS